MRTIYLNHIASQQARWSSWLLLAIGTAALLWAAVLLQQALAHNTALKQRISARENQAPRPSNMTSAENEVKNAEVKTAIAHIVTPWASLLKSLEAVNTEEVKILSLEPSVKSRTVKLRLVAMHQAGMWRYLESLKQQASLRDVHLVSNEAIELKGAPVLAFEVEATWKM